MRIGILGGGQLARMLVLAGYPLGLDFSVLEPAADACAGPLTRHITAGYADQDALETLSEESECITYEFENVPAEAVQWLNAHTPVFPPPHALAAARDRFLEKTLFNQLEIETAPFRKVDDPESLHQAVREVGLPGVLKTRTLGYDGKGQVVLREGEDLQAAWQAIGEAPAIFEGFVEFQREVSIIAVRSRSGEVAFYPLTHNIHHQGILRISRSLHEDPAQALAEGYARKVLERLDYIGVLAIEFFQLGDHLLANEMAPRVHNSGHWTIEGSVTSQFENHLRAILGWPLGDTASTGWAAMLNLIGELPDTRRILQLPGAHLHLYGKAPREGRKLGHVTLVEPGEKLLQAKLESLRPLVPGLRSVGH